MTLDYHDWWRRMRRAGVPADNVVAHLYTPDFKVIKYDASGTEQPFFFQAMEARRLDGGFVARHPDLYALGAYVVFNRASDPEHEVRNARKKNLFVVDVQRRTLRFDDVVEDVHTADHFSFMLSDPRGDQSGRRLKFHRTEYLPRTRAKGMRVAIDNHLPDVFVVGSTRDEFRRRWLNDMMSPFAGVLYDMFTIPPIGASTAGGGSRRLRYPLVVATFDDVFRALPIRRLLVVAVPGVRAGTHDVTVFVEERLMSPVGDAKPAYFASVPSRRVTDVAALREAVARAIRGARWSDFVSPPFV